MFGWLKKKRNSIKDRLSRNLKLRKLDAGRLLEFHGENGLFFVAKLERAGPEAVYLFFYGDESLDVYFWASGSFDADGGSIVDIELFSAENKASEKINFTPESALIIKANLLWYFNNQSFGRPSRKIQNELRPVKVIFPVEI